jgi:acetyltransferase
MMSIMDAARGQGLREIEGVVLNSNHRMLRLMNRLGFDIQPGENDSGCMKVSKLL